MINILIPMAGQDQFFKDTEYQYPKPLIEVCGKTIIEYVIDNYNDIEKEKQFIFIVNVDDCRKYNLDYTLQRLVGNAKIIKLDGHTQGSACSALMAIEYIDSKVPLLIANSDQLFNNSITELLNNFSKYDGGVITFDSVHPRWAYAKISDDDNVIEIAEKRPISRHALTGFFYFKHGEDFVNSAKDSIRKGGTTNDKYYISTTINEMILRNKKIFAYKIENKNYHTFYTPQKIKDFDRRKKIQSDEI